MTNAETQAGPKQRRTPPQHSIESKRAERDVETSAAPDDSLVRQMSHGDESISPQDAESRGSFADTALTSEGRPEESVERFGKE